MDKIIHYAEQNFFLLTCLFAAVVAAVVMWNLYRREKRKTELVQKKIAGERRFYKAFSKQQEDGFLFVRKEDLEVLYVSPNFESMTGISEEYLKTDLEALKQLVSANVARRMLGKLSDWNQEEKLEMETDYQRINGDGVMRRAKVHLIPIDKPEGYLMIFADITGEYKARQEMYEELVTAQQASQSKTDFLSKMSHEIRTPMNGILGMLSLVRVHLGERKLAEEYLDKTESLSQFLLTLINDILDMSRIESGKMELEQAPFDLFGMADKLDAMFRGTAEAKGIHWNIQMQDFDVRYVIGDEMRLSQVIINFISNANKFTPAGGSVSVTFRQMDCIGDELHLMIRVRDTGKGIRKDFIDKIFRPFEQEDASTAHRYGGSGLGMAIADHIIKLMNGEILVESEEGKGTEFSVYIALPIAENQEVVETIVKEERETRAEMQRKQEIDDFSLEGVKILLAEDNDINAEIAMEILEMKGAVLTRACDGEEAVRLFEESEPGTYDVILMDIQMPKLDGWEATGRIREMNRPDSSLPIFAMSANAFLEDKRRSMEVGMNGHINKPVDYEEVRQMIGACMVK